MNVTTAAAELNDRVVWSLARITELVNLGREAGWISGAPLAGAIESDAVLGRLRLAGIEQSPMNVLAARLGLTNDELDLLWLLVCVELDPHVSHAAQLLVSPGMNELSAQAVERLVAKGSVFERDIFEKLDQLALIHTTLDHRIPLHRRPVRVHDRVIDLARGHVALDRGLQKVATLQTALDVRRASAGLEIAIPDSIRHAITAQEGHLIVATGVEGSGRATILKHGVSAVGHGALSVRGRDLAADEAMLVRQLRSIVRECRIHDAWPMILEADALSDQLAILETELFSVRDLPVFATARETCAWSISRPIITVPVRLPDAQARVGIWRHALPSAAEDVIETCAARYTISPGLIGKGASSALSIAGDASRVDVAAVHEGLRMQLERRLAGIARRIETRQTWDDLVLPIDQFDLLIEMVARVRHRQRVLEDWGFADKVGRGLGTSALFSGPPGTGKTMVAGLLAQEVGLDLYQVDLSKVVSKYIGETEKQLSALFEAAESGHAILLFDEADSLFAKRTEVKSSNDRYANLEVNYLLQRIEAFSGITILTTNHETAIDQAFLRRLAFHVRVPMPDEKHRELIWRSMLPEKAHHADDLEFSALARAFEMSGGYIKNAMLRAGFLAAEEGKPISNESLLRAARAEYEAMGKLSFQPQRFGMGS